MRPLDNIEKLIKKLRYKPSAETHNRMFDNVMQALDESQKTTSAPKPNFWRIIIKSRIARLAAVVVVILAVCWLAVSDRGELKQQETNGSVVAAKSKTPAELVSAISLSMVFRDGGIEAMEKQFDKAEKKVRPGLKERITIDQLICELEECEEI